jgi:hypothetical protein
MSYKRKQLASFSQWPAWGDPSDVVGGQSINLGCCWKYNRVNALANTGFDKNGAIRVFSICNLAKVEKWNCYLHRDPQQFL